MNILLCLSIGAFFCSLTAANSAVTLRNSSSRQDVAIEARILGGGTHCMGNLGCFEKTDDFDDFKNRPIYLSPSDRAIINTRFLLYTRNNTHEEQIIAADNKDSITSSHFDSKAPVKFIVHGFMDSYLIGKWMTDMKNELLLSGNYNVIIVDWSGGNWPPYAQATSNTRVVGAEIDLLVRALEKHTGVKREDCHIIGHSLGAHIAGYAGERLLTLGRITGCDPAGPYFEGMKPSVRLDPTDAKFVDIIHSDRMKIMLLIGYGMDDMLGHVDFFPNGGRDQPGCSTEKYSSFWTQGAFEGTRRFVSCNHQRSVDFFHNSINYHKILPLAYHCSSWEDFIQGKCADCGPEAENCAIMGMRANEYKHIDNAVSRAFYIKTSETPPYWVYHYQVTLKLYPALSSKDQKGKIDISLYGSIQDVLVHAQKENAELIHGSTYQYLITTDKNLGEIRSVTLTWYSAKYKIVSWDFHPKLYVEYITVVPMSVIEKSPRSMSGRAFCGDPKRGIDPKQAETFLKDDKCLLLM